jgi:hypothetical protein
MRIFLRRVEGNLIKLRMRIKGREGCRKMDNTSNYL